MNHFYYTECEGAVYGGCRNTNLGKSIFLQVILETLYYRHDALLYIAYVMLIWAAPIPADRWHCSLWP